MRTLAVVLLSIIFLLSCNTDPQKGSREHIQKVTTAIEDKTLMAADENHSDWLTYGLSYNEDRFSTLDQINKENIDQLELAWALELGVIRGFEATPIVADGIMYITGPWSVVYAIDTRKGSVIWQYDPKVDRTMGEKACCDVVNRGVALYKGDVFFGALDGRLISLDASDGSVNWEVMTVTRDRAYTITGAPRIVAGKVLIGNGGAEYDARGYVTAYDASNGEQVWRFYTVPGNPDEEQPHPDLAEAAKTWTGEWWKMGGGGTVWDAIVFDPELNLVYIGVGNGSPWDRSIRSPEGGDNLYLSSIVALNADDGSYVWHFQTTPGDTWDYTATQPLILADLTIEGEDRKVIMQAPKNGFFYVIDRTDGSFISGKPYTYVSWATGLDENGRPIEAPGARYTDGRNKAISPGPFGGHNWQPMSYSHNTGLVYTNTHTIASIYSMNERFVHNEANQGAGSGTGWNVSYVNKLYKPTEFDPGAQTNPLDPTSPFGRLIAYDPVNQEEKWAVRLTSHWNGGVLSTASDLVFQGNAEGMFVAYDALNGSKLWERDLRSGIIAAPVTYMVDGEQYITIVAGWGGITGLNRKFTSHVHPGTVYTFKLNGTGTYPEKIIAAQPQLTSIEPTGSPLDIGKGFTEYMENCVTCHGDGFGLGGGVLPDLVRSSDQVFDQYEQIVLKGLLAQNGMPAFEGRLSTDEVAAIKQFLLYTSKSLREDTPPMEFLTSVAQMQYLADTQPTVKD